MAVSRGPAAVMATAVFAAGLALTSEALASGASASSAAVSGDWTQGGPQLASRGVVVNYLANGTPRLPKLHADAFVLANAGTGQVLAAKDAHGWFRPASTLKVLTALALLPVLNPHGSTVASRQAADTEPNDAGLVAGRRYPIFSLFQALLTISANDAAVALTQATGSLSKGMALINAEAHRLQADDTVAKQPNGLDAAGQHTSAYDEALIARQALASPAFLGYDRTRSVRFEIKPKHWETLVNQNLMLTDYAGDIGGKIGWTSAAGATYMDMARRNGVTLIVTILHCPPLTEFKYAAKLLDWGFAVNGKVKPVGTLVSPLPATPAAARKPKARPVKHVARGPMAAGGSSPAGFVSVAVTVLAVTALIVAAFVVRNRRATALAERARPRGRVLSARLSWLPARRAGYPPAGAAPGGSRPMRSLTTAMVC